MPVIDIEVTVSPGLAEPVDITPYLLDAMGPAAAEVMSSADAALAQFFPKRNEWARRAGKVGYGPLHGSLSIATASAKGAGAVAYVRTFVFYSRFLETGAKRHPIHAKDARALAIRIPEPPGIAFRLSAEKHPGVRPRYWMRSATAANVSDVVAIITRAAEQWAEDAEAGLTKGMP